MKKVISVLLSVIFAASVFCGSAYGVIGLLGDVNNDGSINNKDVVSLFKHLSGVYSDAVPGNGDYNRDGSLNNKDVSALFKALGGSVHYMYTIENQTENDYKLKVLQFNVQTENGNPAPFTSRATMYHNLIDELQPDVVGMQEVTVTWRKWLDSTVFNDSYAGVGEPRSAGGEANPIYYRKDKFDLLEYGTFWLSATPDVVGSAFDKVNYPRICTWVYLKDKVTGTEFVHFNTHLDHNGNNDSTTGNTIRKDQMSVIIKFAQRFKEIPMFLTGDLNNRRTTSENKTYALIKYIQGDSNYKYSDGTMLCLNLSDARLNAGQTVPADRIATMTKYYDENNTAYNPAREPIDYVFYDAKTTKALTYETFLISQGTTWISDHLPVFATFSINPTQQ